MSARNTPRSYGSVAKTFHWLTALLILTIIPLGLIANDMAHDIRNPDIASTANEMIRAFYLFSLHKTLGVVIFFVALARILWAITQPKPVLLNADNRIEAFLAETVHWLLYGSLVLVPLSGWIEHAATVGFAPIRWPFGQSLPFVPKDEAVAALFAGLHLILGRVLMIALILHIAGALKHHFVDRDETLRRMLPRTARAPNPPAQRHSLLPPVAAVLLWGVAIVTGGALDLFGSPDVAPNSTPTAQQSNLVQQTSGWQVSEGTLGLSILQMGNQVTGNFADWTANITFDETVQSGPAGMVEVSIFIASLDLGSVTAQAMGQDFFAVDTYPNATFTGEIIRTETGYKATGPLNIRENSLPVTLTFDLVMDGDTARMTGTMPLSRLDFGVGANMPDESSLGFGVDINVTLTAIRDQ
jgi:cytochrome b561/polyisoprenoid-binding protein YceI